MMKKKVLASVLALTTVLSAAAGVSLGAKADEEPYEIVMAIPTLGAEPSGLLEHFFHNLCCQAECLLLPFRYSDYILSLMFCKQLLLEKSVMKNIQQIAGHRRKRQIINPRHHFSLCCSPADFFHIKCRIGAHI